MLETIKNPEIRQFIESYVNEHIDMIAVKTYEALVLVDRRADYNLVRKHVRRDFDYVYDITWRTQTALDKDPCEAEIARHVLKVLEKNEISLCIKDIEMGIN